MAWADFTNRCRALQSCTVQLPNRTMMELVRMLLIAHLKKLLRVCLDMPNFFSLFKECRCWCDFLTSLTSAECCSFLTLGSTIISLVLLTFRERLLSWHHFTKLSLRILNVKIGWEPLAYDTEFAFAAVLRCRMKKKVYPFINKQNLHAS